MKHRFVSLSHPCPSTLRSVRGLIVCLLAVMLVAVSGHATSSWAGQTPTEVVERTMKEGNVDAAKIDAVLLVGGMTRVPLLRAASLPKLRGSDVADPRRQYLDASYIDALASDRFLVALSSPAAGQPDIAVQLHVVDALVTFPAECQFAISFSAQDVVSHSHGAESEENLDTLRRLRDLVAELEEMKAVAVRVDQSWRRNYCDCVNERDAAEDEAKKLRANIQRIGRERDQMIAANVELQERLSALEDDGK